jgi:hypothetical protein
MHDGVRLGGKPFPDLSAPGWHPEIVLMQHANSVAPCLLHPKIGLRHPRQQIGTTSRSDEQRIGKAVNDFQGRLTFACVNDNYLNSVVLLIHDRS